MSHTPEKTTVARIGIPYSRFSGKRQEAGDSQRRQDALALKAAQDEGVELDKSDWSDKGISAMRGANRKRGKLRMFLDMVDEGIIPKNSVLIIEQVNRLSRMPWMEQAKLWDEIIRRGIVIRTCIPPFRYDLSNIDELATSCPLAIYMMIASGEVKAKSE
jgi:DNA invertase Pin-like site-specific DNA recombinase